jgi:hypothetical protein
MMPRAASSLAITIQTPVNPIDPTIKNENGILMSHIDDTLMAIGATLLPAPTNTP